MDETIKEIKIAARYLKHGQIKSEKPSGAQRKKDTRKRVKDKKTGVWCLPKPAEHPPVLRGRAR